MTDSIEVIEENIIICRKVLKSAQLRRNAAERSCTHALDDLEYWKRELYKAEVAAKS